MVSRMYPPPVSPRAETFEQTPNGAQTGRDQRRVDADAEAAAMKIMPLVGPPKPSAPQRAMMDWPEIASAPTKSKIDADLGDPRQPSLPAGGSAFDVQPPSSVPSVRTAAPALGGVAVLDPPMADSSFIGVNTGDVGPVSVDDLALEAAPPSLSPRFRFEPVAERADRRTSKVGRLAQGAMLLGLVAAVGAFIVILPDDGTSIESAEPARVETIDRPVATADMPDSELPEIEGSLGDAGGFGNLSTFASPTPGTPADDGDGFEAAVAGVVEDAASDQATTTTTTWVEPTLPPESEWVDAGNGFMVPDLILRIRFCESTNNYQAANPSSSARGAYQFLNKSWDWYGHAARTGFAEAHLATPAQQDEAALLTVQSQGTSPWLASRSCWADPDIDPRYATASPRPAVTTTTVAGEETSSTTEDSGSSSTTTDSSTPDTTAPSSSTSSTETTDSSSSTSSTTEESTTTTTTSGSTTTMSTP